MNIQICLYIFICDYTYSMISLREPYISSTKTPPPLPMEYGLACTRTHK